MLWVLERGVLTTHRSEETRGGTGTWNPKSVPVVVSREIEPAHGGLIERAKGKTSQPRLLPFYLLLVLFASQSRMETIKQGIPLMPSVQVSFHDVELRNAESGFGGGCKQKISSTATVCQICDMC